MTTKVTPVVVGFDHNVTHALILPEHQGRILPVRRRAEAGEIEFVATQELIEEMSRVIETNDPGRLRLFGGVVGALTQGRHLATPEWVVQTELLGRAEPFASEEDRGRLFRYLYRAAEGSPLGDVLEIAADARRKKDEAEQRWKAEAAAAKKNLAALSDEDRKKALGLSFEEFDAFEWARFGWETAEKYARKAGAENPREIADRVMADPGAFPYTRRFMAVKSLLKWWWTSQQRAPRDGDQGDARQLTLLSAMDHFVTSDKTLKKWSAALGDPIGKVVTFEEFFP